MSFAPYEPIEETSMKSQSKKTMSLLGELWKGGTSPEKKGGLTASGEGILDKPGMSYSEAASSSSEDKRSPNRMLGDLQKKVRPLVGAKRPRSPGEQTCGRCFRATHKTSECKHQVVCLRCNGVGHVAARCRMEVRRSPKRKRLHVRSKHQTVVEDQNLLKSPSETAPPPLGPSLLMPPWSTLSLPLTPEITAVREELALVVVVTIISGYVTDLALDEVLPSIINRSLAGPLTPVNDNTYLVPLSCRADVKEVSKMEVMQFSTKDGVCSAKFAPWTVELGAVERASGEGVWVRIWNLPMHGWCWSVILEVLKTVGEMVSLSQEFKTNKRFVSALVRRRRGVSLPMELELSLGMRRYMVLLTEDNKTPPIYRPKLGRFVLPDRYLGGDLVPPSRRAVHEINYEEKGKRPAVQPSPKESEGSVERSSHPGTGAVSDGSGRKTQTAPSNTGMDSSRTGDGDHRLAEEGKSTLVERRSRVGRSRIVMKDREKVVEPRSHVAGVMERPRLLVRGPMGHGELRGGTAGRSEVGQRCDKTKPMCSLSGSMQHGVERWMGRKRLESGSSDSRSDKRFSSSEVIDKDGSAIPGESEVFVDTRREENRRYEGITKIATSDFVDPLEKEAGPKLVADPITLLEEDRVGMDLFHVCEMGPFLGQVSIMEERETRMDLSLGSLSAACGMDNVREITTSSPDVGVTKKVVAPVDHQGSGSGIDRLLEGVDIMDEKARPATNPPEGFHWQFLANIWVLAPVVVLKDSDKGVDSNDPNVSESEDIEEVYASDDSRRSLKELLPGLKGGSSPTSEVPKGVRKSERQKKPSSRWNEEAGFWAEPPRSTKKKVLRDEPSEGTPSMPLLISDWSKVQFAKYCNACGISFDDSVSNLDACYDFIRNIEMSSSFACDVSNLERAETSSKVRSN